MPITVTVRQKREQVTPSAFIMSYCFLKKLYFCWYLINSLSIMFWRVYMAGSTPICQLICDTSLDLDALKNQVLFLLILKFL